MRENAKEEMLKREGDAYFKRNFIKGDIEVAKGCLLFDEFLERCTEMKGGGKTDLKILEIGCCCGYNLEYLCRKYGFEGYGIEPSSEAVSHGNDLVKDRSEKIVLIKGTADELPLEEDEFDIVMIGFCMFWVDRKYIMRIVAEVDRVLKEEGVLAIWDFDTRIPFKRDNLHNKNVLTYKYDLAQLFLGNPQYWLMEKRAYNHDSQNHKVKKLQIDVQVRCALNVLYKDTIENAYVYD